MVAKVRVSNDSSPSTSSSAGSSSLLSLSSSSSSSAASSSNETSLLRRRQQQQQQQQQQHRASAIRSQSGHKVAANRVRADRVGRQEVGDDLERCCCKHDESSSSLRGGGAAAANRSVCKSISNNRCHKMAESRQEDEERAHETVCGNKSGNQVEMIASSRIAPTDNLASGGRKGDDNDKDHSFCDGQTSVGMNPNDEDDCNCNCNCNCDNQRRAAVVEAADEEVDTSKKKRTTTTAAASTISNQNEWNLMQIVESAESKLMRNKQADACKSPVDASQITSYRKQPGGETERIRRLRQRGGQVGRDASTLLLKCPAFATITLDDDDNNDDDDDDQRQHYEEDPSFSESHKLDEDQEDPVNCAGQSVVVTSKRRVTDCVGADASASSFDISGAASYSTNMTNRHCHNEAVACKSAGRNYISSSSSSVAAATSSASGLCERPRFGDPPKSVAAAAAATAAACGSCAKPTCTLEGAEASGKRRRHSCLAGSAAAMANNGAQRDDADRLLEEEREGATPTNDLIRTLIERDRRALWRAEAAIVAESSLGEPSERKKKSSCELATCKRQQQQQQQLRHQREQPDKKSQQRQTSGQLMAAEVACTTSGGQQQDDCRMHCCHLAQVRVSTTAPTPVNDDNDSDSDDNDNDNDNHHHHHQQQQRVENETQNRSHVDKFDGGWCQQTAAGSGSQLAGSPSSDSGGARRLSGGMALELCGALIGKCQRQLNQLSNSSASNSQVGAAGSVSPMSAYHQLTAFARARCTSASAGQSGATSPQAARKSSDLGLQTSISRTKTKQTSTCTNKIGQWSPPKVPPSDGQRRHSTYLLPLLLNEQRASSTQNICDSSDDSDNSDLELKLTGMSVDDQDEQELKREGQEQEQEDANNNHSSASKQVKQRGGGGGGGWTTTNRMAASASSPSALSTPTNEQPEAGGCGGPCCSQRAQLLKLAAENAALSRQLFLGGGGGTETGSSGATKPELSNSRQQQQQQQQVKSSAQQAAAKSAKVQQDQTPSGNLEASLMRETRRRERVGSNPLDRLTSCTGNKPSKQASIGCPSLKKVRKQSSGNAASAASTTTNLTATELQRAQSNKRHSIINILSSAGQVGARSPRSYFFSGSSSKQQQQQRDHKRGSLENGNSPLDRRASETTCDYRQHQQQGYTVMSQATSNEQYEPLIPESGFKIVVMGTSGSGKTSIIQRFMYNSFNWRHLPTVEDTYFIEFPYMKNIINISISDTSGTYQFPAMRKLAINSGDAFILVYSVDDPQSFDDLEQLRQTILAEREQAYLEASASISSTDSASSGLASGGISSGQRSTRGSFHSSGVTTPASNTSHNHLPAALDQLANRVEVSPGRHWSLASLFNVGNHHHHQNHNHNHQQNHQINCQNNPDQRGQHYNAPSYSNTAPQSRTSLSSSVCSSTCSLTNDSSRRSSISAAEAALKTRRTRHPPMVIVANKHDLPEDQHLVDSDEIEALAVIDWNNGFIRASAAVNYNINEIFQQVLKQAKQPPTLAEAIISKRRKSLPPKLPNSMNANNKS